MSTIIATDDQISRAMMNGLMEAFRAELREKLQKEADGIINRTIAELGERIKVKMESGDDFLRAAKHIHLTWCLKAEER